MIAHGIEPVAGCQDLWVTHQAGRRTEPTHALRGVTAWVDPGEMLAVVGPSGSGKSSFLHALAGFVRPSHGYVQLLGTDITRARQSKVARVHRRGVGFVFQSLNLVPSMPVIDNVMLPARFAGERLDRARAQRVLEQLGLGHRVRHRTSDLSGGEQQRAAVARVLYTSPAVVMADEPTGALDTGSTALVLDGLRALASQGTAVLLVTHDLDAAALADRALVMRDGQIVRELHRPQASDMLTPQPPEDGGHLREASHG